jgi:competence protein ComEA
MENNWKDYFSFTKKERAGIAMLLMLIAVAVAAPYFFPAPSPPDTATIEAFNEQKVQLARITDTAVRHKLHSQKRREAWSEVYYEPAENNQPANLFHFDPNTLTVAGWKKLGVKNHTINIIQKYIARGGRFRAPADLQKIYGLKKEDFDRLQPYVQIKTVLGQLKPKFVKAPAVVIDINVADTTGFIALPGIGSKLANRIINFRDKLGGFYSVEQLAETYGLPDSTFQLIKPQLQCSPTAIRKININTADANTLKQHPYIKWNIANAIIQFRQQHGIYHSTEDLQQIAIITPEIFQKIAGYVTVE